MPLQRTRHKGGGRGGGVCSRTKPGGHCFCSHFLQRISDLYHEMSLLPAKVASKVAAMILDELRMSQVHRATAETCVRFFKDVIVPL